MRYVMGGDDDECTVVVGGAEVRVYRAKGNNALSIDVTAPGALDARKLLLDEDGDAYVSFCREGTQVVGVDLKPGPHMVPVSSLFKQCSLGLHPEARAMSDCCRGRAISAVKDQNGNLYYRCAQHPGIISLFPVTGGEVVMSVPKEASDG